MLFLFQLDPTITATLHGNMMLFLGVTKYGLPYANSSYLIDQPPLGFYIQAGFLTAFGTSINNGTFLVTLFGLGSVILVYLIG